MTTNESSSQPLMLRGVREFQGEGYCHQSEYVQPLLACGHYYAGMLSPASSQFDFPDEAMECAECGEDRQMDLRLQVALAQEEEPCSCRRCAVHNDPGGCLVVEARWLYEQLTEAGHNVWLWKDDLGMLRSYCEAVGIDWMNL